MFEIIKKYWDIFGGIATAIGLSIIAKLQLETVQLYYSIVILALVCIGVFRVLKQAIEKNRKNKKLPPSLSAEVCHYVSIFCKRLILLVEYS